MVECVDAFQFYLLNFLIMAGMEMKVLGNFIKEGTIESSRYGRITLYFEKHLNRYISLSSQSPYIVAIKMFEAI